MLPLLEELAEELSDKIDIVKFNCNAKNKELGKTLNVKVAPTFHLYKNNNKVTTYARLRCLGLQGYNHLELLQLDSKLLVPQKCLGRESTVSGL